MIFEQLATKNKKLSYWSILIILIAILLLFWIILSIQSTKNKEFTDKQAQTAAKEISSSFKLELINSLEDKYNPTELELKKINPYTEVNVQKTEPTDIYYLESSGSAQNKITQSSASANLKL